MQALYSCQTCSFHVCSSGCLPKQDAEELATLPPYDAMIGRVLNSNPRTRLGDIVGHVAVDFPGVNTRFIYNSVHRGLRDRNLMFEAGADVAAVDVVTLAAVVLADGKTQFFVPGWKVVSYVTSLGVRDVAEALQQAVESKKLIMKETVAYTAEMDTVSQQARIERTLKARYTCDLQDERATCRASLDIMVSVRGMSPGSFHQSMRPWSDTGTQSFCHLPGCSAAFHTNVTAMQHRLKCRKRARSNTRQCLHALVRHGYLSAGINALKAEGSSASININRDGVLSSSFTGSAHFVSVRDLLTTIGDLAEEELKEEADAWKFLRGTRGEQQTLSETWERFLAFLQQKESPSTAQEQCAPPTPEDRAPNCDNCGNATSIKYATPSLEISPSHVVATPASSTQFLP